MENGKVNEVKFCKYFLEDRPLIFCEGAFFNEEGRVPDENQLRREIYDGIKDYVSTSIPRKVENILSVLRMECGRKELKLETDMLHLANGTMNIPDRFTNIRTVCRYRLPVRYIPSGPEPVRWMRFLDELLEPEDIDTLQEFMGYCLIPTNIAQKMLIIIGRGGEGKSRIGVVMKAMLGNSASLGSLAKVEGSPFARADLEHKLLLIDDDLKLEALPSSNYIKSIISAELPMDLERKGIQSYQGRLHARFMAFGNGNLQAVNDWSYGFFRRQIILSAKPRDPQREDDPFLADKLKQEIDGIFLWALDGLYRLLENNFQFTMSPKAKENLYLAAREGNNTADFLESEGYVRLDSQASASTRALYEVYKEWCADNAEIPVNIKRFCESLRLDGRFRYDNNVIIGNGRRARGFRGLRTCSMY